MFSTLLFSLYPRTYLHSGGICCALVIYTVYVRMYVHLHMQVDVLFEEHDKGFWSAVYEVLRASRKPIILTSNGLSLCAKVDEAV